jgi:hypothetical protein
VARGAEDISALGTRLRMLNWCIARLVIFSHPAEFWSECKLCVNLTLRLQWLVEYHEHV